MSQEQLLLSFYLYHISTIKALHTTAYDVSVILLIKQWKIYDLNPYLCFKTLQNIEQVLIKGSFSIILGYSYNGVVEDVSERIFLNIIW